MCAPSANARTCRALALGASRGRLVRQALVLSTVWPASAARGILLAIWSVPVVNHFLTDRETLLDRAYPRWLVLAVTVGSR